MKTLLLFSALFLLGAGNLKAQRDKRIELSLGAIASATGVNREIPYMWMSKSHLGASAQLLYKVNPYLCAGIAYSVNLPMSASWLELVGENFDSKTRFQSYGLVVKAGTSRYKRICIYVLGGVSQMDMADDFSLSGINGGDFTVSGSGLAYQAGIGVMIKFSRSLSLKLFEAGANYYTPSLNYLENTPMTGVFAESGLVFMLVRKK